MQDLDRTRPDLSGVAPPKLAVVPPPRPAHSTIEKPGGPDSALDVRLHAPTPDAVIVWVAGALHRATAPLLALRAGQQLHRARHLILDLSAVTFVDSYALGVLRTLHDQARGSGTRLHIAGVERDEVAGALRRGGFDAQLSTGPAAADLATLVIRRSAPRTRPKASVSGGATTPPGRAPAGSTAD